MFLKKQTIIPEETKPASLPITNKKHKQEPFQQRGIKALFEKASKQEFTVSPTSAVEKHTKTVLESAVVYFILSDFQVQRGLSGQNTNTMGVDQKCVRVIVTRPSSHIRLARGARCTLFESSLILEKALCKFPSNRLHGYQFLGQRSWA